MRRLAVLLLLPAALGAQPLLMSKDANGKLGADGLSLVLTALPCDETGALLPDGSTFVAEGLALASDANPRGVFRGFGTFSSPGGTPVMLAIVHGFLSEGITCLSATSVRTVHLAATLEPVPTFAPAPLAGFRADNAILEARLTVDGPAAGAGDAGTLVRGSVEGLVTPAPGGGPGEVTIASDRSSYGVDDVVTAFVVNGSDSTILAYDGQAFCTIVGLERRTAAGWQDAAGCPLARLPLPTKIPAGETVTVALPPGIAPHWEPGTYRLRFFYETPGIANVVAPRAYSAPFEIAGTPPPTTGVTLTTSRDGYREDERIVGFLENGTESRLTTTDHRSFCTIVNLEKEQPDGSWALVSPCLLAMPTRQVDLEPHSRLAVALPPEPSPSRNEPGLYRLSTDVFPKTPVDGPQGATLRVVSAPFMVFATRADAPDVRGD